MKNENWKGIFILEIGKTLLFKDWNRNLIFGISKFWSNLIFENNSDFFQKFTNIYKSIYNISI